MGSRDDSRALGFRHGREQRESDEVRLRLVPHKAGEPEDDPGDDQVAGLLVFVKLRLCVFSFFLLIYLDTPLKIS